MKKHGLLFALAAGLGFRLLLIALLPSDAKVSGDTPSYFALADGLLAGHGFTTDTEAPFHPSLERTPTYSLFVAAVWALTGRSLGALSIAQALVDMGSMALIHATAKRRWGDGIALGATLAYALLPFTAGTCVQYMSEGLCGFLVAVALYTATRAAFDDRGTLPWAALGGAAWGGAVLARPYILPVIPFAAAALWFEIKRRKGSHRPGMAAFVAVGIASVLTLAPWVLRNARVAREEHTAFVPFQHFHSRPPLTTMFTPGFSAFMNSFDEPFLWTDLFRPPVAHYSNPEEQRQVADLWDRMAKNEGVVTPEMNAEFESITAQRYKNAPLRLYVWRPISIALKTWFSPRTSTLRLTLDAGARKMRKAPWLIVGGFLAINTVVTLLALGGMIRELRRDRASGWFLTAAFLALTVVLTALAMRETRLTMPFFPILCMAAAVGADGLLERARRFLRKPDAAGSVALPSPGAGGPGHCGLTGLTGLAGLSKGTSDRKPGHRVERCTSAQAPAYTPP